MVSRFPFTPPLKTNSYSQLAIPSLAILVSKHLFYSYFHSLYSQKHKFSLFQNSLLHWSCAPPKVSPPLKFYSPEILSSIEDLSSPHEGMAWCLKVCVWVWCLKKWICFCLGLGMISRRELLIFVDLSFFGFGNGFTKRRFDVWNCGFHCIRE